MPASLQNKPNEKEVMDLLCLEIPPYLLKIEKRLLKQVYQGFIEWYDEKKGSNESNLNFGSLAEEICLYLNMLIVKRIQSVYQLKKGQAKFLKALARVKVPEDRERVILDYAQELGASLLRLRGDRKAFKRWFGDDAVRDRYQRQLAEQERLVALCLQQLGRITAYLLKDTEEGDARVSTWQRINIEESLADLLSYEGDTRLRLETFRCFSRTIFHLPKAFQEKSVSGQTLQYIYRAGMSYRQDTWIQIEALRLLERLSMASLVQALNKRLLEVEANDNIFVRRECILLWGRNITEDDSLLALADQVMDDRSDHVRQGLAEAIMSTPKSIYELFVPRILRDPSPQVKAAMLLSLVERVYVDFDIQWALKHYVSFFIRDNYDDFSLRVGFVSSEGVAEALWEKGNREEALQWSQELIKIFQSLRLVWTSVPVKRWVSKTMEKLWICSDEERFKLYTELKINLGHLSEGKQKSIRKSKLNLPIEDMMRILSVLAQEGHGFDVLSKLGKLKIQKGHRFTFRLWRFVHEMFRPAPDKRQAFSHTTGREFKGSYRAPSSIMAEMSETRVPGEPLYLSSEDGWRPYLPLLDELISCQEHLLSAPEIKSYHPEGVTTIKPPRSPFKRLFNQWHILRQYVQLSRLRNWKEDSQEKPSSYINRLRKMGFKIEHEPHVYSDNNKVEDTSVSRFFLPAFGLPFLSEQFYERVKEYFFSAYGNSLKELAYFIGIASAYFFGQHVYVNRKIKKIRAKIPLVIGGWGTRGKSGTERLKAALINSLGYGMVSKTSGCEAMFIYACPYGNMREMFLFRPYDKATIWEQINLLKLSTKLNVDVFLWECMALTPSYVKVLQKHWTRDDLSTITNTYPDHEDLQGPAGINIPQVMTEFIPEKAMVITTEEVMRPILEDGARKYKNQLKGVGWLEAGLIADDILKRFAYEEHPYNIALVTKLAEEINVDREYALKAMADFVVADLGVLKAYPIAEIQGKYLEFVMGMSANERLGCMTNWKRMRFEDEDHIAESGVWTTTVVNNRADRVARSNVFAAIISQDTPADAHFLIGNNLSGFIGVMKTSWKKYIDPIQLFRDGEHAQEVLEQQFRRQRAPTHLEHLEARLKVMLKSLTLEEHECDAVLSCHHDLDALEKSLTPYSDSGPVEEVMSWYKLWFNEYGQYEKLKADIEGKKDQLEVQKIFHQSLSQIFESRVKVLQDYHATGDSVIQFIIKGTPPGFKNRMMGMQNIKGTGLDFVYRFQAWENCYKYGQQLLNEDVSIAESGLKSLSAFQEFGLLSEDYVIKTVEKARANKAAQSEFFQAELDTILERNEKTLLEKKKSLGSVKKTGWITKLLEVIETFLDASDAVKRRKQANAIYKDLANERISQDRASLELHKLIKRQKGGWLAHKRS